MVSLCNEELRAVPGGSGGIYPLVLSGWTSWGEIVILAAVVVVVVGLVAGS